MQTTPPTTDGPTTTRRIARRTGAAYLGIVVCGLVAEFLVRMSLVVPGDAVATADAIAGAQPLFLGGVAADVTMIVLDVVVAFGLFRLLRHVDERLAIVATASRLLQAAVLTVNLVNPVRALTLADRAADGVPGAAERALAAMEAHALVYDVALIAFGVSCIAVARLLRRSGAAPTLLARGVAATGAVYLVGSLAAVAAPGLSAAVDPFYLVAIVVEPAFALWLVLRGARLADGAPAPLPRWIARVNRSVLNPREIARGERPVLTHVGRRSGRVHRTPLEAYAVDGGFVIGLLYGSGSDWVRNVLAAGSAELEVGGRRHLLTHPRLIGADEADRALGRRGRRPRRTEHLRLDTVVASDVTT